MFFKFVLSLSIALGLAGCVSSSGVSAEKSSNTSSPSRADKQSTVKELSKADGRKKLYLISKKQISDTKYKTYGLTGENKPNGIIYRLRESKPVGIPDFVNKKNYDIVDVIDDGWVVLDRKRSVASGYDKKGIQVWSLRLQDLVKEKRMEVQDIHYENDVLYFNAACMSYSNMEKGKCSSLYAVKPVMGKVLWHTPYLTSNNIFILEGDMIIAGYGFTSEPDHIFLIHKKSGKILYKQKIDSGHNYMEVHEKQLHLITYGSIYIFDIIP